MSNAYNHSARGLKKPNFTMVPDELLDNLDKFSDAELRITLAAIRYTIGFQRNQHHMSRSFFMQKTGLSSYGANSGIKAAKERGWLRECGKGSRNCKIYKIVFSDIPEEEQPPKECPKPATQSTDIASQIHSDPVSEIHSQGVSPGISDTTYINKGLINNKKDKNLSSGTEGDSISDLDHADDTTVTSELTVGADNAPTANSGQDDHYAKNASTPSIPEMETPANTETEKASSKKATLEDAAMADNASVEEKKKERVLTFPDLPIVIQGGEYELNIDEHKLAVPSRVKKLEAYKKHIFKHCEEFPYLAIQLEKKKIITNNPEHEALYREGLLPAIAYYAEESKKYDWDGLVSVINKEFGIYGRQEKHLANMLLGRSKTGEWAEHNLDEPATPQEIRTFMAWYRKKHPNREQTLKKPDTIQSYLLQFRAEESKKPVTRVQPVSESTPSPVEEISDEELQARLEFWSSKGA